MKIKINTDSLQNEKIAIYGTGENASVAYQELRDCDVVCFVEKSVKKARHLGIRVLTIEDAVQEGVSCIIVAARLEVEKIIYDRIHAYCMEQGIKLFGIHSGDMSAAFGKGLSDSDEIRKKTAGDMKQLISEYEVISFDIFDTLIMRDVIEPMDVFDLTDYEARRLGIEIEHFRRIRIKAELNVLRRKHTFEEIYDEVQRLTGITDEDKEQLKKIEKDMEMRHILRREDVAELFQYAVDTGRRVFLVSDMYHSKEFLEELLKKNAVTGYEDILISGYEGVGKREGLFGILKERTGDSCVLHLGDNYVSDGLAARTEGFDAVVIESAKQKAERDGYFEVITLLADINSRLLVGRYIAKVYNNAFGNRLRMDFIKDYPGLFAAPMMSGFVIWLIRQLENRDYDRILFCSRDGFLLKKMYDYARKTYFRESILPESLYFYTSRMACIEAAEKKSAGYRKYIEKCGLKEDGKYAFVDFMSTGTSLECLKKVYFQNMTGFFLSYQLTSQRELGAVKAFQEEYPMYPMYLSGESNLVLEIFMTSDEPSVQGLDEQGNVIFAREIRDKKQIKAVGTAQEKMLEYFREFLSDYVFSAKDVEPELYRSIWMWRKKITYEFTEDSYREFIMDDSVNGRIMEFCEQI